ncbi:MAG TPA: hypothetical protein VFQ58_04060, partial [Flavisolibacter sp.]|nr:hypothetical protein [Flavisolibacter sp.]
AQYHFPDGRACPVVTAYAYGLRWMQDCEQRVWVGHTGGLPGFGSNWNTLPDYGIGIISFANLTYAPTAFINLRVLDTIVKLAHLKPRQLKPSPILLQRQKELMKLLPEWNNALKSEIFAMNFFMDYNTDSLRKEAISVFEKAGSIIGVHDIIPENLLRGSFILEGEKANIIVSFTLTPENPPLIQEYHISLRNK